MPADAEEAASVSHVAVKVSEYDAKQSKIISDPALAGGFTCIPDLLMAIVDTTEFQRLRHIKQLGTLDHVYPSARHSRFEHSLGTCHLAGKVLETLIKVKPSGHPEISERDVLCVQIAALIHDLGHGPFSHFYDNILFPYLSAENDTLDHESLSFRMFEHLLKKNPAVKAKLNLDEKDMTFIRELICGPVQKADFDEVTDETWPYEGRPSSLSVLFEIVSNKWTGIDVDKFDYLQRDGFACGLSKDEVRVLWERYLIGLAIFRTPMTHGLFRVCHRAKDYDEIESLFRIRSAFHSKAYQHAVNICIECMHAVALKLVCEELSFLGEDNKVYNLRTAVQDMTAYSKLTDDIVAYIRNFAPQQDGAFAESRLILEAIDRRELWPCFGRFETTPDTVAGFVAAKRGISKSLAKQILEYYDSECGRGHQKKPSEEDIIVFVVRLDDGADVKRRLGNVIFHDKQRNVFPNLVPARQPKVNQQVLVVYAYCKAFHDKALQQSLKRCFDKFCKANKLTNLSDSELKFTPAKQSELQMRGRRDKTPVGEERS